MRRYTIQAVTYPGDESGYVAECLNLAVVTQGKTLDETAQNLREAIQLHLDGEGVSLNSRDEIGQQLKGVAFSVESGILNGGARSELANTLLSPSALSVLWNTLLRRTNGQERFQLWSETRAVQSLRE